MSRAELEHALARVLEEKEIRLKNNKLPLQPRCIERFTIPGVKTHWPVIFANALRGNPNAPMDSNLLDCGRVIGETGNKGSIAALSARGCSGRHIPHCLAPGFWQ
jgi:hypothetical protein